MRRHPIIVAHGIYGHGEKGPDLVIPMLEDLGYDVHNYDYRYTSVTTAGIRYLEMIRARRLARYAETVYHTTGFKPDFLGHSFGVRLGLRAPWHATGTELFRNFFGCHGAARTGIDWSVGPNRQIEKLYLLNYPHDSMLLGAKLLKYVSPWNQMGPLGRDGYKGPENPSIIQHNLHFPRRAVENTHGAWFNEGRPELKRIIEEALTK